jgi:hypothetical protein
MMALNSEGEREGKLLIEGDFRSIEIQILWQVAVYYHPVSFLPSGIVGRVRGGGAVFDLVVVLEGGLGAVLAEAGGALHREELT